MNRNKKKDKDYLRLHKYTEASTKCKRCGHTMLIAKDRSICTWCGYWVYKNSKIEFRYKIMERMKGKFYDSK